MEQVFHHFQQDPTETSSPTEVRLWIEGLDYNFLLYGEIFERAEINGERLLNITQQRLTELGITRTDHQDILLKAVANICRKIQVEEQAMQEEDQNDKKMPTRFGKQSEHLEHAIDRVLVMISERRRARSLHGTIEQPPHNILAAALELTNMVKMILNILERPPFDCMSEFSSLKSHLIKHITLLKHFSEQSDLSHEMESDIIDVCKGVTKICHYIIALPPDIPGPEIQIPAFMNPEERPSRVQVPVIIEPEATSFTMENRPDYMPPTQYSSMLMTTTSSASEPVSSIQDVSLPNEKVPDRFEYFSSERLNTPINEETFMLRHNEGHKCETEVSDTKSSVTPGGSLIYKSLQDLTIIESGTPLMDSGSERCVIDSDSDRGIGSDYDLEQHSKGSDSVIWGIDSDSETCPRDSASRNNLLEAKRYQMASGSEEDLMESEQHLVKVEQCQVDSDSLKHWMDSGSEKCLADSDSEQYLMDSDNERLGIDSDSEKCPMASASEKHKLKAEKHQMASDSIKRLMESEKSLMETEKFWMVSASKRYVMDSETEIGRMNTDSKSRAHLMGEEKHEIRSKRYMMDSDSEPCGTDSDTERYDLASATEKSLMDPKTFQLSTDSDGFWIDSWSEKHTVDLKSESLGMASDSVKHLRKAKTCQSVCDLERFWMGKSKSERKLTDSAKEQSDFDHGKCWDSPRKYQHRSVKLQNISESCQDDSQNLQYDLNMHNEDSRYEKHRTSPENERNPSEFESKRCLMEMEREQLKNVKLQVDEESESHLMESDNEKKQRTTVDSERHHLDSENEAQRLGARRKENRPQGFWRPVFLPPPVVQGKETKEQHSVQQQIDSKVSRIQLVKYLSDDKIVRLKEMSPALSEKHDSQTNVKEKHSNNHSSDPKEEENHGRKASRKISFYKSHYKNYRYAHSFQSSGSQFDLIHPSAEVYSSVVAASLCSQTSISPNPVVYPKTQRNNITSVDMGAKRCFKCFMEITDSPFHQCVMNSEDDSDPDCPLHLQIPLDSKYSLSPKSDRHNKTYQFSPLSQTLDQKCPVDIYCPLHQEDSKYSLGSTSYLHCESCSAFQNLISSITHTFPINSENIMGQHSTSDPDTVINTCSVTGVESEHKFNLNVKHKNENNPDNEMEDASARNLNNSANAKDKSLPKDEKIHETDTNSEDETDAEDETDPEDENNTKEKKDPKDKSDSDDNDPKDSNSEYDANNNNESDPSGDAGPTSGTDPSSDGDPNDGTNPNSETDPNFDNTTNNDADSKYSTDPEEDIHTNNSYSASVLVDQDNTANSNNGTDPNYTSGTQNRTNPVYTSGSNNDAGPSNATKPGNDICSNIGPGFQNIRSTINSLGPSNSDFGPNNFPNPNNTLVPHKDPDSNYNVSPSNVTSNNNDIIPNSDTDFSYDARPTSATGHNYSAATHCDSDYDYVPEFTHAVGSSFVANPNYIDRNSYAVKHNSAASTVNFTNTNNTTSYSSAVSPRYNTGTNYDADTNHIPRFTHLIDSTIVVNTNYNAINMPNAHNSANTSNNLSGPELEISSSTSVPNIIYGNSPTFAVGTSCISTPKNLTTSKFSDSFNPNFDDQKYQIPFKVSAFSMDSTTFIPDIESKDFLDAKESGFSKDSSGVQNTIDIKDHDSLNVHYNPNITLPSFDIIVEAEPPDVVKFAISSGAVNQFFKLFDRYDGVLKAEGGSLGEPMGEATRRSSEEPVWRTMEGPARAPERGLLVRPKESPATSPAMEYSEKHARGRTLSPTRGFAVHLARDQSVSPARGPSLNPTIGHTERHARGRSMSPIRKLAVNSVRGCAVSPAKQHDKKRNEKESAVSPTNHLSVRSSAGFTVSPERGHADRPARGRAMSPTRGRAVSAAREFSVRPVSRCAVSPARHQSVSPSRGRSVSSARGHAERYARGHPREHAITRHPARGHAESPARVHAERHGMRHIMSPVGGYVERPARRHTVSPSRRNATSPTQGLAMGPARRPPMRPEGEFVLGAAVELTVKPAEGYAEETSRSTKKSTQSTTDRNQNRRGVSILTDSKADGFIYLPEFRIGLAPHCRRNHAFQATHARIKNFYFAAECSDEMNYWIGQMLQLAYGSSFGDAAANAEYRRIGAMIYAKCVLALKRDFPVIWCDNCHEATTIVSVNPNFQYRGTQNVSDEFIYFRPFDAEIREKARRQKQDKSTMASRQHEGEGIHQRDLGIISQVVMVTTPPLTKEVESTALVRPKTSGLLRLEKIPVKSPGVPESQRLDVTGIASPEERGKGTAILVAGVPGKEELDDTEIPTLKFTGLIHLEALISKCSPSSEYSCPRTPRNLWLESPENAESPGSDDLEVARSMNPLRERSIFRRSWAELLEAPLNSEGLHILQTTPTEEDREIDDLQLAPEEENQATTPPMDPYFHPLQDPFPLLPQRPKLQRQRSHSLPRYSDGRSQKLNVPELALNPEEKHFFFPSDHNLLTGENAKERDSIEEAWQKAIFSGSGEYHPINPSFEYSSTMWDKIGIPEDNTGFPKSNVRLPNKNVMVNVGVPTDNSEVLRGNAGIPTCNPQIPSGSGGVPWYSGVGVSTDNVVNLRHNVGTSRRSVSSLLTELSKIGEHRL
uniref:uncharacterized protein LOC101958962 isoform X3 n=1 Tax=Ictidomys tridecemlineatus TaxID=43179 RepID=UPI001A9EFB37|nr:uncharacterized protein LOC101958962 isoform X3 [Ictidomys tridecemlineatus]